MEAANYQQLTWCLHRPEQGCGFPDPSLARCILATTMPPELLPVAPHRQTLSCAAARALLYTETRCQRHQYRGIQNHHPVQMAVSLLEH